MAEKRKEQGKKLQEITQKRNRERVSPRVAPAGVSCADSGWVDGEESGGFDGTEGSMGGQAADDGGRIRGAFILGRWFVGG